MQISKLSSVLCAAAIVILPASLRAADTDTQQKLRDALRQKLNETTPATAPVTGPAPVAPPAAQPTFRAPVLNAPPPVAPEKIEQVREALRQKMRETEVQPATGTPELPVVQGPNPVAPEKLDAAREALRQEMVEAEAQEQARKEAERRDAALRQQSGGYEPLRGPPVALAASKQLRLQNLLAAYRADQITPEQYHAERAKILAEP